MQNLMIFWFGYLGIGLYLPNFLNSFTSLTAERGALQTKLADVQSQVTGLTKKVKELQSKSNAKDEEMEAREEVYKEMEQMTKDQVTTFFVVIQWTMSYFDFS